MQLPGLWLQKNRKLSHRQIAGAYLKNGCSGHRMISALQPFLFWRNTIPFFILSDKMTAVIKSGFLGDIVHIKIGVQK